MDDKKEYKELEMAEQQDGGSMPIPVGSADVKEMIAQRLYADKTAYIAKLFRTNGIYYFFTRPRRFGKSLLLDTIDQIAQGNKALFKECAIYADQTYTWKKYPVIWLNFSELTKDSPEKLHNNLIDVLYTFAKNHSIDRNEIDPIIGEPTLEGTLGKLIDALKKLGNGYEPQPVVLIDEYDSPLISCKREQYASMLDVLSSFFKVLKARQKACKFILVTGVTKFHLSGLTSGANSANDISLHEDYAEMLGYTEEDVDKLFFDNKQGYINAVLTNLKENWGKGAGYTAKQLKQALKAYYNGYCFSRNKGTKRMYNPDSILKFFRDKSFGNYWSNSGNPAILLQQIRNDIDRFTIAQSSFAIHQLDFENLAGTLAKIPLLPLMYQTGYLTLDPDGFNKDIREDKDPTDYYLKFPNEEVWSALKSTLVKVMDEIQEETGKQYSTSILHTLRNQKWSAFLNYLRSDCLAKAGYRFLDKTEKSFQRALYLFLSGVFHARQAMQMSAESDSGMGRTDIVMEDHENGTKAVYLFELKLDKPALGALQQIYRKDYSIKYGSYSKKVLIGLTCDAAKLNITEAIVEVHQRDDQDNFKLMPRKNFTVHAAGYFQESESKGKEVKI